MSPTHSPKTSFASDNYAGAHPKIIQAMQDCNVKHVKAYGYDPYTTQADQAFQKIFGPSVRPFYVFSGTGANILSLKAMITTHQAIICTEIAHLNLNETGAPEAILGSKLLTVPSTDGKIRPEQILKVLATFTDEHQAKPKAVSIAQTTEYGTVYSVAEIRAIAKVCKEKGLLFHVDGARISNAVAALGVSVKEMIMDSGVDVLSFGGNKNGLVFGEAVVFFNPKLAEDFKYIRKQGLQLCSKMRFLSSQFIAYLDGDLWIQNARHANEMAQLLKAKLEGCRKVKFRQSVESNVVFAIIPKSALEALQSEYHFYVWSDSQEKINGEECIEVRWMTSFDTTPEDVESFSSLIHKKLS